MRNLILFLALMPTIASADELLVLREMHHGNQRSWLRPEGEKAICETETMPRVLVRNADLLFAAASALPDGENCREEFVLRINEPGKKGAPRRICAEAPEGKDFLRSLAKACGRY